MRAFAIVLFFSLVGCASVSSSVLNQKELAIISCINNRNIKALNLLRKLHLDQGACRSVGMLNMYMAAEYGSCLADAGDHDCGYCSMSLYSRQCEDSCKATNAVNRNNVDDKVLSKAF